MPDPKARLTTFEYNGFTYNVEIDGTQQSIAFNLIHPKGDAPEFLFKYYPLNSYSIDSVLSNYLFSSHPSLNNDKYDCAGELIDYSNVNLETFILHLVDIFHVYDRKTVVNAFNSDKKWSLSRSMSDVNQFELYKKFGIISLTENFNETLMWAYYSLNQGFTIKLKTDLIPSELYGPFPINYVDRLHKISYMNYEVSLCVFYQTNIKQNTWEREKEWRYLTFNPNGEYNPFHHKPDIKTRKFYYNKDALYEIILGYDFFDPREVDYNNRTIEYDIISFNRKKKGVGLRKLKRHLLTYIAKNNIKCSQVFRHLSEYQLKVAPIEIEKLSANRFKIIKHFED